MGARGSEHAEAETERAAKVGSPVGSLALPSPQLLSPIPIALATNEDSVKSSLL